ncbi:MAG: tRNA (adenosine(37)-N6)-threonylcarbamoyltransferase complex dimerization subunit type 1 TsaB [Clostridia bacterium]|nr:tRNA (adenosine(37)-N6)-threonylcarbamoyltransferase complex dimerization subunit type 1 TsaB [Clostridia bacterium]
MKILCLDSTAKVATAALLSDGEVLAEYTVNGGLSHSELLLPMIRSLLTSCALTEDDIDLFACTAGPGSFTGVRIGVSLIKGLAFGRGKPVAAVSALEALAESLVPLDGILCPVMDARRGQVYNALFRCEGGVPVRLTEDRAIAADELAEELTSRYPGEGCRLVGDGYRVAEAVLAERGVPLLVTPLSLRGGVAAAAGRCAYRMAQRGETVTDEALRPLYLRLPQAERERLERLEKEKNEA